MNIALYFDDHGFSGLDLSKPREGNNGVGGTQYCFLMLAEALASCMEHSVTFYHYHDNTFPAGVKSCIVQDTLSMVDRVVAEKCDVLIFKADNNHAMLEKLKSTNIKCIAWAHNYVFSDELNALVRNDAIKRIVFVGKEQYDRYIDHPIIEKAAWIHNMFDSRMFAVRGLPETPAVTYTGSLVHAKGFHILANSWKRIIEEVPDAQLYVIGSGRLYDRNAELGPLGVAAKNFEAKFADKLMENGKLLPSVHFCGTMGLEKLEIYEKTTVGVMNPSGRTETFGLSAVEMEACGIPVVTKATNGLFDTVVDKQTGFLIRNADQLTKRIIQLLNDEQLNREMGRNAKEFADSHFLPECMLKKWNDLLVAIIQDVPAQYDRPRGNYTNGFKWVRMLIRIIRKYRIPVPPLVDIECKIKKLIRK